MLLRASSFALFLTITLHWLGIIPHIVNVTGDLADLGSTRLCVNVGCRELNPRAQTLRGQIGTTILNIGGTEAMAFALNHYHHGTMATVLLTVNGGVFWRQGILNMRTRSRQLTINRDYDAFEYQLNHLVPLVPISPCCAMLEAR